MAEILYLFNTLFVNVTRSEACSMIENSIKSKLGFTYFAVKDVALVVRSLENNFLRTFYESIPFALFVDGMGLVYVSKLFGRGFKEMVGGPGTFFEMINRSNIYGYRLYFLGAEPNIIEICVSNLKIKYTNLNIVGFYSGYFSESDEKEIVVKINKTNPDILFLGISSPERERFILRNYSIFGNYICLAVGGVFDIVAQKTKIAPKFISLSGFEWLYRVIQEPKRLTKRYFYTHTKFFYYLFKELLK